MFLVGGGKSDKNLQDVDLYKCFELIQEKGDRIKASHIANLDYPRYYSACLLFRDKFLVVAGTACSEYSTTVEIINLEQLKFKIDPKFLHVGRLGHSMCVF
jgi:hypothetical protein